ncbi:MAG: hypothetical protein COA69_00745 [Robiginitomaculum sp.]|nr:MAG: hypothetical protein COA69_00745 [Robiginitomaculum sp.]
MAIKISHLMCSLLVLTATQTSSAETFKYHQEHILGTSFDMVIEAKTSDQALQIKSAAISEILRLETLLSIWKPESEISRLNAASSATLSPELFSVLQLCKMFQTQTSDAFSCRMGESIALWKTAAKTGIMPDENASQALATKLQHAPITFDPTRTYLTKPLELHFNIDGVAKGWIIDKAMTAATRTARAQGLTDTIGIVLDIGGDIRIHGKIDGEYARIGIANPNAADNSKPSETMRLTNQAIATSGSGKRDLVIGNRQFSHIISPLTGRPQTKTAQVTVIAPNAATADALATAFSVMGVANSLLYANEHDGIETMIITSGGARFTSDNWSALSAPTLKKTAQEAGIISPLPNDFGLHIDYAIPRIDTSDYEYPYVVMWITDTKKKLVQTINITGDEPRWVEENYVFWRRYGRKHPAMVESISRPSRAPGRYTLMWDGFDTDGNPSAQGDYILHIEASREHGGHQYIKQELALGVETFEAIIESGAELGQIEIHYGLDN